MHACDVAGFFLLFDEFHLSLSQLAVSLYQVDTLWQMGYVQFALLLARPLRNEQLALDGIDADGGRSRQSADIKQMFLLYANIDKNTKRPKLCAKILTSL